MSSQVLPYSSHLLGCHETTKFLESITDYFESHNWKNKNYVAKKGRKSLHSLYWIHLWLELRKELQKYLRFRKIRIFPLSIIFLLYILIGRKNTKKASLHFLYTPDWVQKANWNTAVHGVISKKADQMRPTTQNCSFVMPTPLQY